MVLPDATTINADTHRHNYWAFSAEGVYRLTFEMSGTLASGQQVSDRQVLTVAVGNIDPSTVSPAGPTTAPDGNGDDQQEDTDAHDTSQSGSGIREEDEERGAPSGGGTASGALADTGADDPGPLLTLAVVLLLAGVHLVAWGRRHVVAA